MLVADDGTQCFDELLRDALLASCTLESSVKKSKIDRRSYAITTHVIFVQVGRPQLWFGPCTVGART